MLTDDRVAYGAAPVGAYSEARLIPADRLLKLPDSIDDKTAAAMMLKGLTTQYLIRQTYRVKAGDTILLHAAAGGVGLILSQWAKHLGAKVIGTVGNDEKAKLAQAHGCAHTIVYTREDFVKRVIEITEGKKVPVVYDSVGKDTFLKSLDCLAPLGVVARFEDGSQERGSFLVGADGIWSATRQLVDPAAPCPEYTGLIGMGGEARGVDVDHDPGTFQMMFGTRAFFGFIASEARRVLWFANLPMREEPDRDARVRRKASPRS